MTFLNVKPSLILSPLSIIFCVCLCAHYKNNIKSKLPAVWSSMLQIVSDVNKQWKDCALFSVVFFVWKWRWELWFTDEQEAVQKRTFTKWINSHLAKVGESVSIPAASASIGLSLDTNTGRGVLGFKTSPPHCSQLCCSSMPHVTWLWKNPAELVMGLTVPAKNSHTLILPCMPFLFVRSHGL